VHGYNFPGDDFASHPKELTLTDGKLPKMPSRWPLVVIGLDKLFKAAGLLVLAFLLHRLMAPGKHQAFVAWVNTIRLEPHNWFIRYCLERTAAFAGIKRENLNLLHIGTIIYAGLYLIEGVGLIFDKKWAEWVVVITTAMFLPLEIYEIWRHITVPRCLLFLANLAMAGYLIWRLHRQSVIKREQR
jgi:uncharacterized membrane protein (DUF2068 family)